MVDKRVALVMFGNGLPTTDPPLKISMDALTYLEEEADEFGNPEEVHALATAAGRIAIREGKSTIDVDSIKRGRDELKLLKRTEGDMEMEATHLPPPPEATRQAEPPARTATAPAAVNPSVVAPTAVNLPGGVVDPASEGDRAAEGQPQRRSRAVSPEPASEPAGTRRRDS